MKRCTLFSSPLSKLRFVRGALVACGAGLALQGHAATYYVDSRAGNDTWDGKAAAVSGTAGPWKSLARLARATLIPGDRVVLACGSVWRETLRLASSGASGYPIVVGAPASGCTVKPAIDGSVDLPPSAWKLVQGQLYQAQLASIPLQLYGGNALWTPASHPNRGYDATKPSSPFLPMAANGAQVMTGGRVRSTTVVTGSELVLPAGASVTAGTVIRIRTNAWTVEERRVTAKQGGSLVLDTPTSYPALAGWGYLLMGQPWMVDSAGEWQHDSATGRLLAWMPGAGAPTATISAAVLDKGVDLQGRSFVQLVGLAVRRVGDGMVLRGSLGVQVRDTSVQDTTGFGIDATGSTALTVEGNSFSRTGKDAIQGVGDNGGPASSMVVRGNAVQDSGVVMTGEAILSLPIKSIAAISAGENAVVEANSVVNAGYGGIHVLSGSRVARNYLYGACTVLDDCGAVYIHQTKNISILQNVVNRVRGNVDGKPPGSTTAAQGIYLDEYVSGSTVERNTVIDADNGVQIHVSSNNAVRYNVLYNNRRAQLWMQADKNALNAAGDVFGTEVRGNLIAPASSGAVGIRLDTRWGSTAQFGTFSANRYLETLTSASVTERTSAGSRTFSFKEWQGSSSVGSPSLVDSDGYTTSSEPYTSLSVSGTNLVANGQFSVDVSGWSSWNQTPPAGQLARTSCAAGATGYCLRYVPGGSAGLVSAPNFSVRQGQWYRLSVDVLADQAAQPLNFIVRRGGGGSNGYEVVSDRAITFNASNTWRRFTAVFQAIKTVNKGDPITKDLGARIDIDQLVTGRSVTLANFELLPVTRSTVAALGSVVTNIASAAQTVSCPAPSLGDVGCAQLARLSDGTAAAWPLLMQDHGGDVLFARIPTLYDADRDGIADTQDLCPATAPGNEVNGSGCALGQR